MMSVLLLHPELLEQGVWAAHDDPRLIEVVAVGRVAEFLQLQPLHRSPHHDVTCGAGTGTGCRCTALPVFSTHGVLSTQLTLLHVPRSVTLSRTPITAGAHNMGAFCSSNDFTSRSAVISTFCSL